MTTILLNLSAGTRARVFTDADFARLARLGALTTFDPQNDSAERFTECVAAADAMLTCWGSRLLRPADLPMGGRTKPLLVAHAAGAIRGVCEEACLGLGVRLTQSTQAMAPAVAQVAIALMILALRQAVARAEQLKAGQRTSTDDCLDFDGLRVGLVGLSRVGTEVARLLAPFGCTTLAYDPFCTPERAAALGVTLVPELETLLTTCPVISLHAPVTPGTLHLIDAQHVARIPTGTAIVNTARSAILDQDAVFARALAGELTYYADVTEPEPLPVGHPALNHPNIWILPHIAGASQQTYRRMADTAISEIERFLTGEPLVYEVTAERYPIVA